MPDSLPSPDISLLIGAALLFVAGIIERVLYRRHKVETDAWVAQASKADGVVTRINTREVYRSYKDTTDTIRKPVVRFRGPDGVDYEFESDWQAGRVGSPVKVAFDPEAISETRAVHPVDLNPFRTGCGFILMTIAVGLVVKAYL